MPKQNLFLNSDFTFHEGQEIYHHHHKVALTIKMLLYDNDLTYCLVLVEIS